MRVARVDDTTIMSSSTLADVSSTAVIGVDAKIAWRRYRDLIVVTAVRSLKVRYRGSFLGMFWSLSNPLIMTLVYTLVFGSAFKSYYDNSILVYVLACFTGLAFLNFFSGSTSMALVTVVSNGGLLNKLRCHRSSFPLQRLPLPPSSCARVCYRCSRSLRWSCRATRSMQLPSSCQLSR